MASTATTAWYVTKTMPIHVIDSKCEINSYMESCRNCLTCYNRCILCVSLWGGDTHIIYSHTKSNFKKPAPSKYGTAQI